MGDLVQRLRDDSWRNRAVPQCELEVWHATCVEAADTIEQLRLKVTAEQASHDRTSKMINEWRAQDRQEIERLRTSLHIMHSLIDGGGDLDIEALNAVLIAEGLDAICVPTGEISLDMYKGGDDEGPTQGVEITR